jgi:hypothetical protein
MSEVPDFEGVMAELEKIVGSEEALEFKQDLMRLEPTAECLRCQEKGTYELQFQNTYCGYPLVHQSQPYCQFRDSNSDTFSIFVDTALFKSLYHCKREGKIAERSFDGS